MKKIFILTISMMLLFSCNQKEQKGAKELNSEQKLESQNFDWLLGKWKRNNEEKGKETFEKWDKINDSEYHGIGFTMQNGDTISQEKIKLIKTNDKWNLVVKTPEEKESTLFSMSEMGNNKFVCTNDSIEFPNRIEYWKNGEKMNALISGDSLKISFEFEKIK